jgi:hypothetical protein
MNQTTLAVSSKAMNSIARVKRRSRCLYNYNTVLQREKYKRGYYFDEMIEQFWLMQKSIHMPLFDFANSFKKDTHTKIQVDGQEYKFSLPYAKEV